jgi:hypothetical protein
MLERIGSLIRKEFIQIRRDRRRLTTVEEDGVASFPGPQGAVLLRRVAAELAEPSGPQVDC